MQEFIKCFVKFFISFTKWCCYLVKKNYKINSILVKVDIKQIILLINQTKPTYYKTELKQKNKHS